MPKPKGFTNEMVREFKKLYYEMLERVKWPKYIIQEYSDIEERAKAQKIFEKGDAEIEWTHDIAEGTEKIRFTVSVKSQSEKKEHSVELEWIRADKILTGIEKELFHGEDLKKIYVLDENSLTHGCKDICYQGKLKGVLGKWDQHEIAAILATQDHLLKKEVKIMEKYKMKQFSDDFINLCDALGRYFKGRYTPVLRREIEYIVLNARDLEFKGYPMRHEIPYKDRKGENRNVPIYLLRSNEGKGNLAVKYGKNKKSQMIIKTDILYNDFKLR